MSKLHLLLFVAGVIAIIAGAIMAFVQDKNEGIVLMAGGTVFTAIAAGMVGRAHAKGNSDAG